MSDKLTIYMSAPFGTSSGYGARSRDLALAIIDSNEFDVKLINTRWGHTPQNFLDPRNSEHDKILSRLVFNIPQGHQPDIWMQVTVPNEFQKVGRFNIGVTAGIETTLASAGFIDGCNKMDLVIGSSKHTVDVLKQSSWDCHDEQTKQFVKKLVATCKFETLFEGVDIDTYTNTQSIEVTEFMSKIPEDFAFLTVGHWLHGSLNNDRKNISGTILTFLNAFKGKQRPPALILKSSHGNYSEIDKGMIIDKIEQIRKLILSENNGVRLPNIYLLHGDLTDLEMAALYNHKKIKSMVLLTKGEGYGRPLAEFALTGKPIIVSKYSGHLDFLPEDMTMFVDGQIQQVDPSSVDNNFIVPQAGWFNCNAHTAKLHLQYVYENYADSVVKSRKLKKYIKDNFSFEKMKEKLILILNNNKPVAVPKFATIKLPTLKKINLPTLNGESTNK